LNSSFEGFECNFIIIINNKNSSIRHHNCMGLDALTIAKNKK
jgi:hypothetical protein